MLFRSIEHIRNIVAATEQMHDTSIACSEEGEGAGVAIDADSFDAVVQHLLNNAIEASGLAAPVAIHVQNEALSVVVDIIDHGPGMTPEFIRDELFRPFTTTKDTGHGIGAYQARELLREAGGDLLVISRKPHGTTMRLMLPAVRVTMADAAALPA